MHLRRHDLFYCCLFRVSAFQYYTQHDVAFAKNACEATAIHDNDTANLSGSHELDSILDGRCPRYGQNRSADYGHSCSSFLCTKHSPKFIIRIKIFRRANFPERLAERVCFLIAYRPRTAVQSRHRNPCKKHLFVLCVSFSAQCGDFTMKIRRLLCVVCLSLFAPIAFGQTDRGTITGTVSDATAAVIPGVAIEAKNVQTGAVYQAGSSETGNYTLA